MANGGDIIIKGSSVDIDYDDVVYKPVNGKPRNHKSDDQMITKVTVEDAGGTTKYDSSTQQANPSDWKITVFCTKANRPATK